MAEGLVIGLEFSTQSAKAVVLELESAIVTAIYQFSYDETFPEYGTEGGVLPTADPIVPHTEPVMLVQTMDELFQRIVTDGIDLTRVEALELDAQHHCTVFHDEPLSERLGRLRRPTSPLAKHVLPALTSDRSPIWEDRSTAAEARLLENCLSNRGGLKKLTGNRAELRFPALELLKRGMNFPAEYDYTSHIKLLSAFLTSVLLGPSAPVNTGDGWGTNLNFIDIKNPSWQMEVLTAINENLTEAGAATGLGEKLNAIAHYDAPLGAVAPYFVGVYGINPEAMILCGTGDNPATLLGSGWKLVVSLGSSHTVNARLRYRLHGRGLQRVRIRPRLGHGVERDYQRYKGSWCIPTRLRRRERLRKVRGACRRPACGCGRAPPASLSTGRVSVPLKRAGVVRAGLDEISESAYIRSLRVSQALSLRLHASRVPESESIAVVGGGSRNDALRGFITDAFGARTYRVRNRDFAAPLGCAIAAARYVKDVGYDEAADLFVQVEECSRVDPLQASVNRYEKVLERYTQLERSV
jgi:sugar (pentulose or hexulose) kinase